MNVKEMLSSKTLGTECIRTLICNVLANHDQNLESKFRLLKVCLFVKLELSGCRIYWTKSARLDWSNLVQIVFLQNYLLSSAHMTCRVLCFASSTKGQNPSHILEIVDMLCARIFCEIYRYLPSYTFRVIKIKIDVKNLMISSVVVSRA